MAPSQECLPGKMMCLTLGGHRSTHPLNPNIVLVAAYAPTGKGLSLLLIAGYQNGLYCPTRCRRRFVAGLIRSENGSPEKYIEFFVLPVEHTLLPT